MYQKVIKKALEYTRPLLISRLIYDNKKATNELSTLIVLNDNGDILTTAKNADIFMACNDYNETYPNILKEINETKPKNRKKIEEKYGIKSESIVGMHNVLIDIADNPGKLRIIKHEYLDLAIISIENKDNLLVHDFPIFKKNKPDVGISLCSVGFALPEYQAFKYDEESFSIKTDFILMNFPIFPTNGILTRNVADQKDHITMFEMSNLFLNGMEGGPILDKEGLVNGITIGTKIIQDSFGQIRLGIGINNETIIDFLNQNNIKYEVK